jgi:HEAT repeat protein
LRSAIAGGLREIAPGNSKLIASLIDLLKTHPDKYTCQLIDVSLDKITFDDSEILPILIELIDENFNEDIRRVAARNSSKVAPENQKAIDILRSLLNSTDTEIQRKSAYRLLKINPNDSKALNVLIELLYSPEKETSSLVARHIWEVGSGKYEVITALTDLMNISTDKETLCIATSSLGEIGVGNQKAVSALIDLMKKSSDDRTRRQAISSLGKIATGNKQAISALIDLISNNSEDEETRIQAASNLAKINSDNSTAITVLVNLLCNSQRTYKQAAQALIEILPGNWCSTIISRLKDLTSVVDKTNVEHSKACYEVLWHCAGNMTYPAFYQAWHQQEDVEKTTTSDRQSLNQADLAQSIQNAIANDSQLSQTIHLICIDGSQFIEPDRPATEIYDQMLDQNCPECDRVPEAMPALKLYWNSFNRNSDKQPVLVFYASSTVPYTEAFLKDLSKFGKAICVITEQPFDHIPLKFFAPSQTIEDVVKWIRQKILEK